MEFWLTDWDRGSASISIRTTDNTNKGMPVSPMVDVMNINGKNVTNIGVLSCDDLLSLYLELQKHLLDNGVLPHD